MTRVRLTDKYIASLLAPEEGKRVEVYDVAVPPLMVRVTDRGAKSFILYTQFPGQSGASRRRIGRASRMTVDSARKVARRWLDLIEQGIDPIAEAKRRVETAHTFGEVAEDYIRLVAAKQRRSRAAERTIRREFIGRWRGRPISQITARDVIAVIDETVDRGAPAQAHLLLATARRIFSWAIGRGVYGIDRSPCDRIKPKDAIGVKDHRTRVLTDPELRALWSAAGNIGYPFGPLFKLLALTGLRLNEVAQARWSEFDLDGETWTIPVERMKTKIVHVVPLTADIKSILENLYRFTGGDFLFSANHGTTPVIGFTRVKAKLDAAMRAEIGDFPPFVLHDIRRTVRTRLSSLPIPENVRELILAHVQKGMHRVYDQHKYLNEKRQALELWGARLKSIVEPGAQHAAA